ncbi:hypothetical protein F1559_004496 [Cyanidiococcus yangmingshanensis]|uniref:Photolyase/cryptochrome alpha/beta domain-containing protein n=1 Tax=Cyanidiococcus yangmingshanensis TaxID=2690220 RepID=A0A7J7IIB7_9RHOD|nr:hypothetical protein F1559_004496 [Cyanidiococcus yangmingshanensis]
MFVNGVRSEQPLTFVGLSVSGSGTVLRRAPRQALVRVQRASRSTSGRVKRTSAVLVRRLPEDWFQLLATSAALPGCGVRLDGHRSRKLAEWLQGAPPKFGPLPEVGGGAGNARIVWWVNQDQRIADNAALAEAARSSRDRARGGLLLAVYTGSVRSCQVRCALRHLREQLVRLGSDLLVLPEGGGAALVSFVERLRCEHQIQIDRIVYNHALNWEGALAERDMVHAVEHASSLSTVLEGHWAGNTLFDEELVRKLSTKAKERRLSLMAVANAIRQKRNGKDSSLELEPSPERLSCPKELCALAEASWQELGTEAAPPAGHMNHGCPTESTAMGTLQRMVQPLCESVTARFAQSDLAELSLVLKSALDLGCISVRQVLKQVAQACQGSYEGYTFSEMIWRSYWAFHMHLKAFGTVEPIHSGKVSAFS